MREGFPAAKKFCSILTQGVAMKKDEEAMKATPRTIQFFLPDGNARSIRIAEVTSRIVQAIQIPRNKLSEAGKREETNNVGRMLYNR